MMIKKWQGLVLILVVVPLIWGVYSLRQYLLSDSKKTQVSTISNSNLNQKTDDCTHGLKDGDINLPYTCIVNFPPEESNMNVSVALDGSMHITRGKETLISLVDSSTAGDNAVLVIDARDHYSDDASGTPVLMKSEPFYFEDINFDGIPDLVVRSWSGAYNEGYDYYLYSTSTHSFEQKPLLKDMINSDFDTANKSISTFNKGRGLGDIYIAQTYTWNGATYVLTAETDQDFIDENDEDKGYLYTEQTLKNGKMVTTVKKTLTKDEVLGN